jgi:hypothetical protein
VIASLPPTTALRRLPRHGLRLPGLAHWPNAAPVRAFVDLPDGSACGTAGAQPATWVTGLTDDMARAPG